LNLGHRLLVRGRLARRLPIKKVMLMEPSEINPPGNGLRRILLPRRATTPQVSLQSQRLVVTDQALLPIF
jgi:hypothetical protein